jgi:hypothetical protein
VIHPKFFRSRQRQEDDRLLKNNVE